VIAEFNRLMQRGHQFTTAYVLQAKRTEEKVNREILKVLKCLLSQFRRSWENCPSLLPLVQSCYYHMHRATSTKPNWWSMARIDWQLTSWMLCERFTKNWRKKEDLSVIREERMNFLYPVLKEAILFFWLVRGRCSHTISRQNGQGLSKWWKLSLNGQGLRCLNASGGNSVRRPKCDRGFSTMDDNLPDPSAFKTWPLHSGPSLRGYAVSMMYRSWPSIFIRVLVFFFLVSLSLELLSSLLSFGISWGKFLQQRPYQWFVCLSDCKADEHSPCRVVELQVRITPNREWIFPAHTSDG